MTLPSIHEYMASLTNLSAASDPTAITAEGAVIAAAGGAMADLEEISPAALAELIREHPEYVPALGYAVGLSHEGLKNVMKHHLGTSGWITLAKEDPESIVAMLDKEYDVVRLVEVQRRRAYDFGDVLIARAGSRARAAAAGDRGRRVEDEIELVVQSLGLPYQMRTQFTGRGGASSPADLAIPAGGAAAQIVVAAKGFNSTGSKQSDAVGEVETMARVRRPTQYVMAAIDGIGWKSRRADLRRLYDLWADGEIDGMYTLSTLDRFRSDVEAAARRVGLL
jgi:hypothetical protein